MADASAGAGHIEHPLVVRAARRLDARVAVSEDAVKTAEAGLGGSYTLLFNGVDTDQYAKAIVAYTASGSTARRTGRQCSRTHKRVSGSAKL